MVNDIEEGIDGQGLEGMIGEAVGRVGEWKVDRRER